MTMWEEDFDENKGGYHDVMVETLDLKAMINYGVAVVVPFEDGGTVEHATCFTAVSLLKALHALGWAAENIKGHDQPIEIRPVSSSSPVGAIKLKASEIKATVDAIDGKDD